MASNGRPCRDGHKNIVVVRAWGPLAPPSPPPPAVLQEETGTWESPGGDREGRYVCVEEDKAAEVEG